MSCGSAEIATTGGYTLNHYRSGTPRGLAPGSPPVLVRYRTGVASAHSARVGARRAPPASPPRSDSAAVTVTTLGRRLAC